MLTLALVIIYQSFATYTKEESLRDGWKVNTLTKAPFPGGVATYCRPRMSS